MDDSHLVFGGQMDPSQSYHDIGDMSIDFEALMAPSHQLSQGLEVIVGHLNHDDLCLNPRGLINCSHAKKPRTNARRSSKPSSTHRSSRTNTRGNSFQIHSRDRHSISNPAPSAFPPATAATNYSWENFFHENIMDTSNFFPSNDKTRAGNRSDQGKLDCDEDCVSIMSCSSACGASCPSQCGETGQGVCCDDDACGEPGPCLDETCQGSQNSCTDANCPKLPISDGDKQAAAALASFGENQLPFMNQQLSQFPPHSHFQPSSVAHSTSNGGELTYPDLSDNFAFNGVFGLSNSEGINGPFWEHVNPENLLATHILQYHNPKGSVDHVRPCIADHPNWSISKCTLPKTMETDVQENEYLHQHQQNHACGFEIDTMDQFADHIFEDHRQIPMFDLESFNLPPSVSSNHILSNTLSFLPPDVTAAAYPLDRNSADGPQPSPSNSSVPNLSVVSSIPPSPTSVATTPLAQHGGFSMEPTTATPKLLVCPPAQLNAEDEQDFCCHWIMESGTGLCGVKFKDADELHKHVRLEHLTTQKRGDNHCAWNKCTRTSPFNQKSKLERHIQTHTGYKPVKCPHCGLQLSAKQALEQHLRIHTGEKPWKCKFPGCTHAFKQQSALTMHERTHTGYRPLVCDICNKTFGESSNLSKHRRTHNTKGTHVCEICNKDFHRLDQLRRHLHSNHKCNPEEVDSIVKKQRYSSNKNLKQQSTTAV